MRKTVVFTLVLLMLFFSSSGSRSMAMNHSDSETQEIPKVYESLENNRDPADEEETIATELPDEEDVSEEVAAEEEEPENPIDEEQVEEAQELSLTYRTHVRSRGWLETKADGAASGDAGSGLRMESIEIDSSQEIGLRYGVHVESIGWQGEKLAGEMAGTTGKAKRIEAIWIDVDEKTKETHDVLYSVYVEGYGWLDWAKNGARTGSMGLARRIESIRVLLVSKEDSAAYTVRNLLLKEEDVKYAAHVQKLGWLEKTTNHPYGGTMGQSLRLEALRFENEMEDLKILHSSHVSKIGWSSEESSSICGTTGQGLAMEALKLRLGGKNEAYYDLYYRVHVQSIGWMGWTMNGQVAGTTGLGLRIEAVEIRILPKGSGQIRTDTEKAALMAEDVGISYKAHMQSIGWMEAVGSGNTAGIMGMDKNLEGFSAAITSNPWLQVSYGALVTGEGWQSLVSQGKTAGTTGQSKSIEAVRYELKGNLARYYDILYRVYTAEKGWLDWSINGKPNGSNGFEENVEAMEVVIRPKRLKTNHVITNPYRENLIPAAKNTTVYYTKESSTLYSTAGGGKILGTIPKSVFLFGQIKDRAWLETDYHGVKGYVSLSQLSGHRVMAAGETILVNKGYGLPSSFAPGVNHEAGKALNSMVKSASSIGLQLNMYSGYRSYAYQSTLFNRYVKRDGRAAAETYSMRPGYSEHQTGLAFDIGGRDSSKWTSSSFGRTSEGIWLRENAHKFGFILRYPEKTQHITGIKYEPWHFRYVGVKLAEEIRKSGKTLDEYFNVVAPKY